MNIGYNVKKIRELRGYDQNYIAKELGMSQSNYSKLEAKGEKLTLEQLKRIAIVLQMDPMDILSFDGQDFLNKSDQRYGRQSGINISNSFSLTMKELYENQIKSLKEEISFLRSQLDKKG